MEANGWLPSIVDGFDQYRARRIAGYLSKTMENRGRILDCGCGKMMVAHLLSEDLGMDVIGLDVISLNDTDLEMCIGDAGSLPFMANSFAAVYAVSVLHHTEHARRVLEECLRVTRDRLVILEDVYQSRFELALLKVFDWIGNRPVSADIPLPFTFRSERQWLAQFKRLGATVKQVKNIRPLPWRPTRHRLFVLEAATCPTTGEKQAQDVL